MRWSIITEVDTDLETVERCRHMLLDMVALELGLTARTKTIETAALEIALTPPAPVRLVRPLADTRKRKLA